VSRRDPNGKETGAWRGFYRDGAKRFEGSYADGNPTGAWTNWQPTGALLSEGSYDAGRRAGVWTYYDRHQKPERVNY
jgi:antitoxin component YwqK of YwqJK toxin-antitoxin module